LHAAWLDGRTPQYGEPEMSEKMAARPWRQIIRQRHGLLGVLLLMGIAWLVPCQRAWAQNFVLQQRESLVLAPELEHDYWTAQRKAGDGSPGQAWDRIGLHRLLRRGLDPHQATVVFFLPGMNSSGEQILADGLFKQVASSLDHHPELPAQRIAGWRDELKGIFERSTPHVLAEAGYVVYAMDYRGHFVPSAIPPTKLSFMSSWGWAMFLDDIATAIQKAKEDSGAQKVILAAESLGGLFALNYAACHARQDLSALAFIDGGDGGRVQLSPQTVLTLLGIHSGTERGGIRLMDGTFLPDALQAALNIAIIPLLHATGTYASDMGQELATVQPLMWQDPLARPVNPANDKPYPQDTYMDWAAQQLTSIPFHLFTAPDQNTPLGLAGIWATFDRYFPLQVLLESMDQLEVGLSVGSQPHAAKTAGVCSDGRSFLRGYNTIAVPTIGFLSHFGLTLWGPWNPLLGSRDVTLGGAFPDMGHLDMYIGTNTDQRISQPLLHWLVSHDFMPQRTP
jgi:pimeloyl-ACP methyl ester carboxylesterase